MRKRRIAALATGGAAVVIAWHTGWGRGERPLAEATGWDELAPGLRPPDGLPWPSDAGPAPRLDWLGHSGIVLDWYSVRLAFDPNLSARCTIVRRELELTVAPEELGALDAVVVSHAHYDHLDRATIEQLPSVARIVLPVGSEAYVEGWRRDSAIVGLAVGGALRIGALELIAVPAFHHGSRFHPLSSPRLAVGWVVRPVDGTAGASIYVAGDTGRANDFEAIGREHRPTLAVLPIGAFLPPWPIGRVHLSPDQAVEAALALGARIVMPYHFGTFALALDRPESALPRFALAARAAGVRWTMPELARPNDRGGN